MKSKWLSRILFLLAGIIFGAIITSSLIVKSTKTATDLISLSSRAWEANQAINAYQSGNPEIARHALNHYADILKFYYDNKGQDGFPEATSQDLAFSYIRLGNIAKNTKKSDEAEQLYDKGFTIYKQYRIDSGKAVLSREKLIESVNRIDAQRKPIAISFSDASTGLNGDASRRSTEMETKDFFYALGIIATVIISIWNIVNNYKASKKTSFINTVTSERVKWLNNLRQNISDFCGLTHTWTRSKIQDTPEEKVILQQIDKLRYLIRLQLSPKEENGQPNIDKQIEDLIAKIPELTDISKRRELDVAMNNLIIASQDLLKAEWEKVKAESKKGDLKDA